MRTWINIPLLLWIAATTQAQAGRPELRPLAAGEQHGIVRAVSNATYSASPDANTVTLKRVDSSAPITLQCVACQSVGLSRERDQWWVLPSEFADADIQANTAVWLLPSDPQSGEHAWRLDLKGSHATMRNMDGGIRVSVPAREVQLSAYEGRPHSDPFGNRFSFQVSGGAVLEDALAAFYWGTMLPSVAERTLAARFPYSDGYVLSTLNTKSYAGSYPAVDHEFQIKGRIAMASDLDLDVARRMIELQFRLMQDDPEHLYRSPTSVQPDGRREYHIRRDSKDARENAAMFPLTANIEVVEESWLYYQARKDRAWLQKNIENLEHAAGWTLAGMDQYGRVWSDVYYEDQVIKDGRETEAQAFAASSFHQLAAMERVLGRTAKASTFDSLSARARSALIAARPQGYWDQTHRRFVDWVDRNGQSHDHTALLANTLPVTLGYATPDQARATKQLVEQNAAEFRRFPSFVAADIAAYSPSEMGVAGPYDLSAAGRYWFWDAAYLAGQRENATLFQELAAVADEGKASRYWMGERYDMDHVYYQDGKHAHGAEKYYEYPNVFAAVLIGDALGLTLPADADVAVAPHLTGPGSVEFQTPAYQLRYICTGNEFRLKNLAQRSRRFAVDLSSLRSVQPGAKYPADHRVLVTLRGGQEMSWRLQEP